MRGRTGPADSAVQQLSSPILREYRVQFLPAIRAVLDVMRERWRQLFLTDLLFKAVAFLLLTPLAAGLLHVCLWAAGSGTLADADILFFFGTPYGLAVLLAFAAVSLGIIALEQATLLVLLLTPPGGASVRGAVGWALSRSRDVIALTARLLALAAVASLPFLAVAGLVAWSLLGEFDINYYLTERPPAFQWALGCGGVLAAGLSGLLAWLLSGWLLALPVALFEQTSPAEALATSRTRVAAARPLLLALITCWGLATFGVSVLATSTVVLIARELVPLATATLPGLVLAIGATLVAWFAVGLAVNLLATTSFAALLAEAYHRLSPGESPAVALHRHAPLQVPRAVKLTRWRVFAGLVVGCLLVAAIGAVAAKQVRFADDVEVMGHRGAGGLAPENTLAAIEQAIAHHADWVEIDVQETADGEVVVVHDSDFMKLAGVNTKIWNATLADVEAIDVGRRFDPAFTGEGVPTLRDVLETCRGRVGVNVELKDYGHGQQLEERVIAIVEDCNMQADTIFMSLKPTVVQRMKSLRPEWTVGLLMSLSVGDASSLEADFLAVNSRFVTRGFVHRAHQAGKRVFAWTTNDAVSMSSMISRGVDGVITDYPNLAESVLQQRRQLSPVERVLLELAEVLGVKVAIGEQ